MAEIAKQWQQTLYGLLQRDEHAMALRDAAVNEQLADWTKALTTVVVQAFRDMGYAAAAKGHRLQTLPIDRNEYLSLDVMAFDDGQAAWRFPFGVVELENSLDDRMIAYSLWKVLCVRAAMRVVFCYRKDASSTSGLMRFLRDNVIKSMQLQSRVALGGESLVVVGTRAEAGTFPYGFFKWWRLDINTGAFALI